MHSFAVVTDAVTVILIQHNVLLYSVSMCNLVQYSPLVSVRTVLDVNTSV